MAILFAFHLFYYYLCIHIYFLFSPFVVNNVLLVKFQVFKSSQKILQLNCFVVKLTVISVSVVKLTVH